MALTDLGLHRPDRRLAHHHDYHPSSSYSNSMSSRSIVGSMTKLSVLGTSDRDSDHDVIGASHSVVAQHWGHTGCVNAMDWSHEHAQSSKLATAGDDTKICIWTPGIDSLSDSIDSSIAPTLHFGLTETIETGHRANIFSVKWSPFNNTKLFSCAGDSTVRVYDINNVTNSSLNSTTIKSSNNDATIKPRHPTWTHHQSTSACTRVLRCHTDRVKRISTDSTSPDVFLTCGEDGKVIQHDLRTFHQCRQPGTRTTNSNCPPPLADYKGMSLYTLSSSTLRPHLFVVAGTSPFAFLHDRRMLRKEMKKDFGIEMKSNQLTQCVRRFGVPKQNGHGY
ncbi:hypothetical protein OIO90_005792, partial [Microbotryomycetes sp. JL221]